MRSTTGLALVAIVVGCPGPRPPEECDLAAEVAGIARRWPTAQDALDDHDVYRVGVWYWAHGERSVDGFGGTLALVDAKPGPLIVLDPIEDLTGGPRLRHPSLLFYDVTDGPPDEWPLIGAGYHYAFTPCRRPALDCVADEQFWVHEAGYHHVPFGDGGMTLATPDDLKDGAVLDDARCNPITDDDLVTKVGLVKHGRAWVVHLWLDPDGGPPRVELTDPWKRWRDAPDDARVEIGDPVFGEQASDLCDCTGADSAIEPPSRGCG